MPKKTEPKDAQSTHPEQVQQLSRQCLACLLIFRRKVQGIDVNIDAIFGKPGAFCLHEDRIALADLAKGQGVIFVGVPVLEAVFRL